jgi:hypothetical protein
MRLKAVIIAVLAAILLDYSIGLTQSLRWLSQRGEAFASGSKRTDNYAVYWVNFTTGWFSGDAFTWGPVSANQQVAVRSEGTSLPGDWFTWTAFANADRRDVETVQRFVGLPWRSWSWTIQAGGQRRVPPDGLVMVRGGVPVPKLQPGWDYRAVRVLPTNMRPLAWSGNVAVIAIALLALQEGGRHFRGRWRARRGMCTQCGYLIQAAPICPECGKPTAVASMIRRGGWHNLTS